MKEKDDEAAAGESEVLQEDVVDEREHQYKNHASEIDGSFPADAAEDVRSIRSGYDLPHRLSHVACLDNRVIFFTFAWLRLLIDTLLVFLNEVDDHRDGEEEREEERHEEYEHGDPADREQFGTQEKDNEERNNEDAHAHDDAVLPRLQARHVAVVEQHVASSADVGAIQQHERVFGDVLVRVEEQRHDGREHARVHRHRPDARSLLGPHACATAAAGEVDDEDDGEEVNDESALGRRLRHRGHVGKQTRGALYRQDVERQQTLDAVGDHARHEVLRPMYTTEHLVGLDDYVHLQTREALYTWPTLSTTKVRWCKLWNIVYHNFMQARVVALCKTPHALDWQTTVKITNVNFDTDLVTNAEKYCTFSSHG